MTQRSVTSDEELQNMARLLAFPLSSDSEEGLRKNLSGLLDKVLDTSGPAEIEELSSMAIDQDLCRPVRVCVLAGEISELRSIVQTLVRSLLPSPVEDTGVCFIFPGQGSEREGMCVEFAKRSAVFRHHVESAAHAFSDHFGSESMVNTLKRNRWKACVDDPIRVQAVLFCLMTGIARYWAQFDIVPRAVVGQSQGEISAAHVAGLISLEEASRIVRARCSILRNLYSPEVGVMTTRASAVQIGDLIARTKLPVEIAAINSPSATTVSGDLVGLERLARILERATIPHKVLRDINLPAHSSRIENSRHEFLVRTGEVRPTDCDCGFYSTVTGELTSGATLNEDYWFSNLRQPVRFHDAVDDAIDNGISVFFEIAPTSILQNSLRETIAASDNAMTRTAVVLSVCPDTIDNGNELTRVLASLYEKGCPVIWPNS
jgi:acyl transferase domain-containing protein